MKKAIALSAFILAIQIGHPSCANEFVMDGFGIVPSGEIGIERQAWAGARWIEEELTVVPASAVDELLIFVGPKSIFAGGAPGLAATLGLDRDGNLVDDGLNVTFSFGSAANSVGLTYFGIAEVPFHPGYRSGIFAAGATHETSQSTRSLYRVVADLASVHPELEPIQDEVLVESISDLATQELADQYGNSLEDGIALGISLLHASSQVTWLPSSTIDGRGRAKLLARDLPGDASASLAIASARSAPKPVIVAPLTALNEPPMRISSLPEINAIRIHVGPLLTNLGHLLNDGSDFSLSVTAGDGRIIAAQGWIQDGNFEATLPLDIADGPFLVTSKTALGEHTSVPLVTP